MQEPRPPTPTLAEVGEVFRRRYRHVLDRTVVYPAGRWAAFAASAALYGLRVYYLNGWYIVTYGLGIFLLNLFIGFLTPQVDPDMDGPSLPFKTSEGEFRPFTRKVPEFQCWHSAMRAVVIAFALTTTSLFNIPVFWPILVAYFIGLFGLTMRKQVAHMIKHRYVPWDLGKKRYKGGKKAAEDEPRFSGSNIR